MSFASEIYGILVFSFRQLSGNQAGYAQVAGACQDRFNHSTTSFGFA
jgi:hypothetical protein